MFYDAHLHCINKESGGFIIGLEGSPYFDNVITNKEVINLNHNKNYIGFYYVSKNEIDLPIKHKYLKYHPRREKYSPQEVISSINHNKPKCIMIDTLNEPYWTAYDYWKIAKLFSDIIFIFPHSGGYLINDFIKICHFQKNVWIDFSLTHDILGKLGCKKSGLQYVNQAITYALQSSFNDRILLGSDFPFFSQENTLNFYKKHINLLNKNFIYLFRKIK